MSKSTNKKPGPSNRAISPCTPSLYLHCHLGGCRSALARVVASRRRRRRRPAASPLFGCGADDEAGRRAARGGGDVSLTASIAPAAPIKALAMSRDGEMPNWRRSRRAGGCWTEPSAPPGARAGHGGRGRRRSEQAGEKERAHTEENQQANICTKPIQQVGAPTVRNSGMRRRRLRPVPVHSV